MAGILFAGALLAGSLLLSCNGSKSGGAASNEPELSGSFKNCFGDSVRLYEIVGNQLKQLSSAPLVKADKERTFTFKAMLPGPGFYQIGLDQRNSTPIVLGYEKDMEITADCANLGSSLTTNSGVNQAYKEFMGRTQGFQQKMQMLRQNYQNFMMSNPAEAGKIKSQIDAESASYQAYMDSLKTRKDVMATLAGVYSYPTFQAGGKYATEQQHFVNEFFAGVNWADPYLPQVPHLMEKTQVYVSNLFQMGLPQDTCTAALDHLLAKAPQGKVARVVHFGIVAALEQGKNEAFPTYAKSYAQLYPDDPISPNLIASAEAMARMGKGAPAPLFSLATVDGSKTLGPADFKGKFLLLDFWASWCKPCRMENPNVVKMYSKYKGKDFEILSVSLDQEKQKWIDAIAKDGLTWAHVSDLKGWQSSAAQLYGVQSIPATFLLDREGKIIAKNLRGPALEAKMAELLGPR